MLVGVDPLSDKETASMEKMVAMCGLICSACPAFLATKNDDDDERKRVAELWSKEYGADIKPEDVNCVGCIVTDGPHIGHCGQCEIRKCGFEKQVMNCAGCDDYGCAKLEKFLEMVPAARETLEEIRKTA
jgi:hypothetical protein